MKRDVIYWEYKLKILTEGLDHLTEEQRRLNYYNQAYVVANQMAHSGESKERVHSFLQSKIGPNYHLLALHDWFTNGGDVPVIHYIRHNVKHAFSINDSTIHKPHFEGSSIHEMFAHPALMNFLRNTYQNSKEIHSQIMPNTVEVYRGLGLKRQTHSNEYKPHIIESWTTDIDSAKHFANAGMGYGDKLIPHIFKANVDRDDFLWSYKTRNKNLFIHPEESLIGKEEHVPFGHKLKNIERIE